MVLHDLHGGEDKKEWVELFQKKKKIWVRNTVIMLDQIWPLSTEGPDRK